MLTRTIGKLVRAALQRRGQWLIPGWRLEKWDQSRHIQRLFAFLGIDCVLDVGANVGQYHEFLRLHVEYRGRLVSFEPVSEMYETLRQASGADPLWSVHRLALGQLDGTATINVMRERTLSSLLAPDEYALQMMRYEKYLRETHVEATEEVPLRRLDSILSEVVPSTSALLFLKSDTQGYDMSVVRGAAGCLDRLLGLQVELSVRNVYHGSPGYLDALAELESFGYQLTGMFPVQRDPAHRLVNVDCVMIRRDQAERLMKSGADREAHRTRAGDNPPSGR